MKGNCTEEHGTKLEHEVLLEAKNGDSSLFSRAMAEEEEKLFDARVQEENAGCENHQNEGHNLDDSQFTKLDELLTQTQLYTEFLLEKMDDITFVLIFHFLPCVVCSKYSIPSFSLSIL